ncbi:MAG: hypothetical protein EX258_01340 [Sphingomonadaceae bacterium]|nr:MAG: hypothetical protein EX258_01340 [Sphingomonadaceae bacterium]
MGGPPQAEVQVHRIGNEGEPLVIIDHFSGQVDRLRAMGAAAQYDEGGAAYPGVRAPADASYLDIRRELMMKLVQDVFGLRQSIGCQVSAFSLVTVAEAELSPVQRIPHYDAPDPGVIAVMHYLDGPESGGTAFYRHKATGFEAITPEREDAYEQAVAREMSEKGEPLAHYHYGDSDRYEMIAAVEARPDRMALYRGRLLHSGIIPDASKLSSDPSQGRLTVNMFLRGS